MDFGKALTYPFEDEEWLQKLGIGAAVGFVGFWIAVIIPIIGYPLGFGLLAGWQVLLIGNVMRGEGTPLPAWEDWGGLFMKGFLALLALLIYVIPNIIIGLVGYAVQFASAFSNSGDQSLLTIIGVVQACCGCLGLLYAVLFAYPTYFAGLIRYTESETFGTFMEIGTNFDIVRANFGQMLVLELVIFVFVIALLIVGAIPLLLGWALFPIIFTYFTGHLLGQLGTQLKEAGSMAPAAA